MNRHNEVKSLSKHMLIISSSNPRPKEKRNVKKRISSLWIKSGQNFRSIWCSLDRFCDFGLI